MTSSQSTARQRELHEEVVAFWTPERMASARPRRAAPGPVPPRPAPAAPPGVEDTKIVPDPAEDPYRRAGKLFMTFSDGEFFGSASAIAKNGILTAAHNLYDHKLAPEQRYATKVLYVPGFCAKRPTPFGAWTLELPLDQKATIPSGWIDSDKNIGLDYAFCRTGLGGKPDDLRPLGNATGFFELVVDRPDARHWTSLSYPDQRTKQDKFNGLEMWSSRGTKVDNAPWPDEVVAKEGELPEGASGGPWLLTSEHSHKVNGIQTFIHSQMAGVAFSPIFDSYTKTLYEKTFVY